MMRICLALLATGVLLPFPHAAAQDLPPRNVISIQPLSAVFTVFAAEYERAVGTAVTAGLGATGWSTDDDGFGDRLRYRSVDVKVRYYPQGTALSGFSFGGTIGFTNVVHEVRSATPPYDQSAGGGSFGVLLEYQWLLGAKRNFAVALGVGAKALMVNEGDLAGSNFLARYPTARISVGWAF